MMNSSEFKTLIERNVGEIYFADTISKNRFSQLRIFLEKELGVKIPDQWSSTMTYIDLWRKVNTLTENKQNNQKGKGVKIKKDNSVVIVNSKPNPLPVSNKIAKKITEISSQIEDDKEELENYLEEIQNAEPTIDIGSFLGFLPVPKKSDVESAIYQVYDSLCEYIVTCGNAIRSANGNISNILELIQLLATAEADIYNLIDNQALASNELRTLIKEWCKEHGIHDEEVDKLLESSFQRAYTLRDRLNSLKEELYSELNKNKKDVEKILREIPDYQAKIQQSINEALCIIEGTKNEKIVEINQHFADKEKEINSVFNLLSERANKELNRIDAIKQSIDDKENKFSERVNLYFSEIDQREKSIEQLSIKKTEELMSVANGVTEKGKEIEKKANDILNNLEQNNQTFQSNILADFKEKKGEIDNELTRMKESQEWFKKELNKNFEEKVHGLEHQIKTYKIVAIIAGVASVASVVIGLLV